MLNARCAVHKTIGEIEADAINSLLVDLNLPAMLAADLAPLRAA